MIHYYIIITSLLHHYYIIITCSIFHYCLVITILLHCYYVLLLIHYYLLLQIYYYVLLRHYYVIITPLCKVPDSRNNGSIITHYYKPLFVIMAIITHYVHYYSLLLVKDCRTCRWPKIVGKDVKAYWSINCLSLSSHTRRCENMLRTEHVKYIINADCCEKSV